MQECDCFYSYQYIILKVIGLYCISQCQQRNRMCDLAKIRETGTSLSEVRHSATPLLSGSKLAKYCTLICVCGVTELPCVPQPGSAYFNNLGH
jgi:hypothetical protein